MPTSLVAVDSVAQRILLIRGQKVMLDADLAELYGVPTKALNQAVRRNTERFPADFMFQLSQDEKTEVVTNCDHLAKLKYSRTLPYAFTEHGALMLGNVLKSDRAVEVSLLVVRAFVQLREMLSTNKDVAAKLLELERKLSSHDQAIAGLIDAIRQLMTHPPGKTRPIGFTADIEANKQTRDGAAKKQRGFSLVSAIFLLVVIAALGAFAVTLSTTQQQSAALDVQGARAYQAARAGIEWGAYQVLQNAGAGLELACNPAGVGGGPTSQVVALAGELANFTVTVDCTSTVATEAAVTVTMYQLTSTARQGAVATSDFVERQMSVTIAN